MSPRIRAACAVAGHAVLTIGTAGAQPTLPPITVTAPAAPDRVLPPQTIITIDELVDRQPRSLADVLRGIAGITVRANSRGETVARIRGAEERQTQVFLDGAPLAVPWDGRVDLGLLPAGLIGDLRVVKGAAPIEYGTNTVAGVVDFQTRQSSQGSFGHLEAGNLGSGSASAVLAEKLGPIEMTLAAGGVTRDAEPLAGPLPFSQVSRARRANTDLDAGSLFAAIGAGSGDVRVRASVLRVDSQRGIAPESDRPSDEGVRYWRYPDIALTQATLNLAVALGHAELKAVAWHQDFSQRIAQYRDLSYTALRRTQDDDDRTTGARLTLTHDVGPLHLRWAASVQSSTHRQVETDFPSGRASPRLTYRQALYSAGVEADARIAPGIRATLGAAYDAVENPLTGDKPAQSALQAGAASGALRFDIGGGAILTLSGGRRTRFPTARELFGEALGRFALNPDLRPEQAWLADAELQWGREGLALSLNPFLIRSHDTLAQRVLADGRRQRFNLAGATSFGIDARIVHDLSSRLRLELSGTLLRARADAGSDPVRRLPQRPSFEALAVLDWNIPDSFDLRAELRAVGKAIDFDASGDRVPLPAAAELALRAAIPFARLGSHQLLLTFAVDNVTDAQIFPQAGLPSPGRLWRVGLRFD